MYEHSLFDLVCEPGNEIYRVCKEKEMRKYYEKLNYNIVPTLVIINGFFKNFNNYTISLNDILSIIHPSASNINNITSYNKNINKIFLPKFSVNYSLGLI